MSFMETEHSHTEAFLKRNFAVRALSADHGIACGEKIGMHAHRRFLPPYALTWLQATLSEMTDSPEAPKREEQVLVLAASGLTDKEIAQRLGISPDTVGTYWRRILGKYRAASRTEVVAKYTEQRAEAALENLRYVNECLKLVADHMIEHGVSTASLSDAILASTQEWILCVDPFGTILFSNRPLKPGLAIGEIVTSERLDEELAIAKVGPVETTWKTDSGAYSFNLSPGAGAATGYVVACGRQLL